MRAVLLVLGMGVAALLAPAPVRAQLEPETIAAGVEAGGSVLSQYVATAVTSRNGLPQNSVRSIAQSTDGYMWLATEEGLVRYDGNHTRVFDRGSAPLLQDNFIQSVAAAADGSVWVATPGGVSHYRGGTFASHAPSAGLRLRMVVCDGRGTAWVGTSAGLYTVSADGSALLRFAGIARGVGVRALDVARDGSVWAATTAGVWHISQGRAQAQTDGLPTSEVRALTVAGDGSLWVATATEVVHWCGRALQRLPMGSVASQARVSALLVDRGGKLWIGMEGDGLAIVQGGQVSRYRARDGLPSDAVKALRLDRDDNLWVGFNGGGAVRFHAGLFHTYGVREGLTESQVWTALTAHDGSVWTVTAHRVVNHLLADGSVETIGAAQGLPAGVIYSMFEDADGTVWAGTDAGDLLHLERSGADRRVRVFHNPAHAQDPLRTILRGPNGDLYLLYHAELGLVRFHAGQFLVEPRNVPGLPKVAARAADGSLWIGTDAGGVTHWKDGVLAVYGQRQGFRPQFVQSLAVDSDGTVYVGSAPEGLTRIREGRITSFTQENGLLDHTIGSVTDDGHGFLWLTSNKGIFKVSRAELADVAEGRAARVHTVVYGIPDGMRSTECNYDTSPSASLAPDGRLWFATTEGLVTVLPGSSTGRSSSPVAVVQGTVIDGQQRDNGADLTTRAGSHDVEFDFTAPDFAAPERLRFRYRLVGFDPDWIDAGSREQAFYTRLPPGSYRLQVQATDSDGWPAEGASMRLEVPPHFWQTEWFRGVSLSAALLCCWAAYRARVVALRRNAYRLQQQVVLRTAELQEAMRKAEAAQQELQELATRDSLTHLWNRRQTLSLLAAEASRMEREGLQLSVLLLDVDHFKQVNDTHGHLGGDRVLEAVGRVLTDQTRPYDCAGRYGGEEFLVILCNCPLEAAVRRANNMREAIARATASWNGEPIRVTASFGVALHSPGKTIEAVLDEADQALYRAKQAGRNRVCCAPPPVASNSESRMLAERAAEGLAALQVPALRTAWDHS